MIPWDSEEVRAAHARESEVLLGCGVDLRREMIRAAWASFEASRDLGVVYAGPELVERDGSFFIEWRPVGFVAQQAQDTE